MLLMHRYEGTLRRISNNSSQFFFLFPLRNLSLSFSPSLICHCVLFRQVQLLEIWFSSASSLSPCCRRIGSGGRGEVWRGDGVMLFSSAAFHLPFQVCPEPFFQLSTSLFSRNTAMVFNVYIRSGRKMTENEQVDKMLKHFWVAWGQSGTALIPSHWLCSLKIPASCLISHRKEGSFISHFLPEYHLMMLLQYREGSVHTTWRTGRLLRESFHPKALSFVILTQAREGYCQQSLDI